MPDATFSTLWEAVDYDLHKTINVMKGAVAVGEYAFDRETMVGLMYVALENAEEAKQELKALLKHHHATKKEPEKAEA